MTAELSDRDSRPGGRVAASYLLPLLEQAAEAGVDSGRLAQAAGIEPACLAPQPQQLDAPAYLRLMDAAARLSGDPHFGLHAGQRVRTGTYSVYGMILLSCRDFGQALQQTQRYEQLAHDLGRSSLSVEGERGRYLWHSHYPDASRHLAESVFAGIRTFGNWLAGGALPPTRVRFAHPCPPEADPAEYARILGTAPGFGADAHCADFDAALLAQPVPNADTSLYPLLQGHAERLLQERRREGDVGAVQAARDAIAAELARNNARLPAIAALLEMSPRALQRRLSAAGTSFQQLLDEVRREQAVAYLRQGSLGMAEIAFLLGYQEQSAFNHAFRQWTGTSPGAYRSAPLAGA